MYASKDLAVKVHNSVELLVKAYLISGDKEYGKEAVKRAVHVAHWNPEGVTSHYVNNFANSFCLHLMALTYDSCYELLTEEQKNLIREVMIIRMQDEIEGWINNLEAKSFGAHNWAAYYLTMPGCVCGINRG